MSATNASAFERLLPQKKSRQLRLPAYFVVPDGEPPPELYAEPMTIADFDWVSQQANGSAFAEVVLTVMRKVHDASGNKFFQLRDRGRLMNDVPAKVLRDLYDQIVDRPEAFEVLLGKSEATTS